MYAALLTAILWAMSVVFATRSAKILGGSEANFWRLVVATSLLGLWAYTFGGGVAGPSFSWFLLSGLIGIGIGDVALFEALPRIGSRLTSVLIQCLSAPFAAMIEYFWLGTKLTALQMFFGAVVLSGVSMALAPGKHLTATRKEIVSGTLFGVVAALGNAFGAVLSRKGFAVAAEAGINLDGGTSAFQRLIGGLFIGAICLLVVKREFLMRDKNSLEKTPFRKKWAKAGPWVMANALCGQTLGVSFYQLALKTEKTGIVLAITPLTALVVIPFARYFENERPRKRSIVGGIIAVLGTIALINARHTSK